jgi:hypothetical protein
MVATDANRVPALSACQARRVGDELLEAGQPALDGLE